MTDFVLTANIAGGEHNRAFATLCEARAYGKRLQKQPATISFEIKRAEPSGFIVETSWKRRDGRMRGTNCLRFERKLREAEFFFVKLLRQEKVVIGDKAPFGFYLSAFLAASKSVYEIFVYEQARDPNNAKIYKNWRNAWEESLIPAQQNLIRYMEDDRDKEVHNMGSRHNVGREEADRLGVGTHHTSDGIITIDGPPGTFSVGYRPTYFFVIDDEAERKVTGACKEYLALRQQMIERFQSTFPDTTAANLYQKTLADLEAGS